MLAEIEYNRYEAVDYALKWALSRNPEYLDYHGLGGDCTNFVSQCLYAGTGIMNYSGFENGWFYIDGNDRSASWTGVQYLRRFLLTNQGTAVFGEEIPLEGVEPGDVIQLRNNNGVLYHSLIVSYVKTPVNPDNIFICAHTNDARDRKLSVYNYASAEPIHILGSRYEVFED